MNARRADAQRRLEAIDALLADLRMRNDHDVIAKVLKIRDRIARGAPPLKGAAPSRYRQNLKPSLRARELPTLVPIA